LLRPDVSPHSITVIPLPLREVMNNYTRATGAKHQAQMSDQYRVHNIAYKSRNVTAAISLWVKKLKSEVLISHRSSLNTPRTSGHYIHMINEPWTANDHHSEVFQVVTLSSDTFVSPSIPESREKERTLSGKVNCSLPFSKHLARHNDLIWAADLLMPP
jgi:hypothetical protein